MNHHADDSNIIVSIIFNNQEKIGMKFGTPPPDKQKKIWMYICIAWSDLLQKVWMYISLVCVS